jgi:thioesterase domain-containing protein
MNTLSRTYPGKNAPIYIIGHSLGGWNGANLSRLLSVRGYAVEMLNTIDPIGEGWGVYTISNLHGQYPKPVTKFWINMRVEKPLREMDGSTP